MEDLLRSYRETRYNLHKEKIKADELRDALKAKLEKQSDSIELEQELSKAQDQCDKLNSFLSNLTFVIDWLYKGHEPNPRRAIHRRSREQRTILVDPLRMQSYAQPAACGSPTTIGDHERFQIDDALSTLSEREKQAYILRIGLCFTIGQTALEMGISRGAVKTMLDRAEKKILESKANSLFLVG
ncbi:positive control sigma-like factor [compost metagenome]